MGLIAAASVFVLIGLVVIFGWCNLRQNNSDRRSRTGEIYFDDIYTHISHSMPGGMRGRTARFYENVYLPPGKTGYVEGVVVHPHPVTQPQSHI